MTSEQARSMRRRMPPEKPFTGRFRASTRSKSSISSIARRFESRDDRW